MRPALVAALLAWAVPLAAQDLPREVEFPTYPVGPPVVALGGAGTAWAHDAAGSLNPATLLHAPRISLYHYEGFADYGGDYAAASVAFGPFALAVSLRRFGWDQIIEDDLGVPTGGLRTGDAQYALVLAAAPLPRLQLGVAASRLISDNLGVRISGTSWSFGGLLRYAPHGQLGLAVLHAGTATGGAGGERYELPTNLRLGMRQRLPVGLEVVADGIRPVHRPDAWTAHLGLEWRAPTWLVLRAGLESLASPAAVERDTRGAAGLGLVVGPLEVSFTTRFGGPAGSQEMFVGLDALRPR